MSKIITALSCILVSSSLIAQFAEDNIGYGYIEGIKIGNYNEDQISVLLAEGYTHDRRDCFGTIFVHAEDMSQLRFESIRDMIFLAHQNQNKIRFHSHLDVDAGCRATFVMVGEEIW
ncbi:MAG: hypothetical protein HOL48_01035 [Porticoccaceae bacterium]|jgi:hypothetical protein|nr:hypothetical protein [Porticoccaceae bacterium]